MQLICERFRAHIEGYTQHGSPPVPRFDLSGIPAQIIAAARSTCLPRSPPLFSDNRKTTPRTAEWS
nr:MAG TPA: Transcription activation/repressor/DNA complex-trefoil, ankyrin, transcription activation, DNA.85A [Caudoviricetes sp.]